MIALAWFVACTPPETSDVHLIPVPVSITVDPGGLWFDTDTRIVPEPGAELVAEHLAAAIQERTGLSLSVVSDDPARGDISLGFVAGIGDGAEAYVLDSTGRSIVISAGTPAGLFYGTQTLLQLVDEEPFVPAVRVEDGPRFAWRGAMLDVARHFYDVPTVERFIDGMAAHKLNRLHLHLTDDQGWRIEIASWPLLAEVGGASAVGGGPGGFYTQSDYARIVAYAQDRHITVVPEIDVPGHVTAAQSAYGELNADGLPAEPYTGAIVPYSSLYLDSDAALDFVTDVFGEVAALTPGPWMHMGGDEAPGIDDADYDAFVGEVQDVIEAEGKTLVGWEEVGRAPTMPYLAQAWVYQGGFDEAAAAGAPIIASPADHAYLDMKYDIDTPTGTVWAGFTDVRDAYEWDPVSDGLTEEQVAGVEGALWTETVATVAEVDLLTWPRLAGYAEIGWSARDGRDWEEYRVRLAVHGRRLDAMGLAFHRSPLVDWE